METDTIAFELRTDALARLEEYQRGRASGMVKRGMRLQRERGFLVGPPKLGYMVERTPTAQEPYRILKRLRWWREPLSKWPATAYPFERSRS